jgi:putative two-component system response regulator
LNHPSPPPTASTLLIVDDEPANLSVLSLVLKPHYQVLAARHGKLALELLQRPPRPDLVLLDIMMPEMDGYQVLAHMNQDPALSDIPVIFVTALDDDLSELKGLRHGAVDFITKPIKAPILLARVRAQLELKAARDHLEQLVAARTAELVAANQQLKQSYLETVRSFSVLIERRDPALAGHSRRVADGARRLARALKLSAAETQDLVFAGLLSRIGTISLPERLLTRPWLLLGKEDRAELVRQIISAQKVLDKLPPLREAARLIANQFEHQDGSGFPNHLMADQIPLGARILAVARDFDLLISGKFDQRSYSPEEAKSYLLRRAGSHYDPVLVNLYTEFGIPPPRQESRPIVEAGLADLVEGMELAEVSFGSRVYLRDTIATKAMIQELQKAMQETGEYCAIKVRVHRMAPDT